MDGRRAEPRYPLNEDAFFWDLHRSNAGSFHLACITDVSRNGMRLHSRDTLPVGSHVAIDFRGMIVCGAIQYSQRIKGRFAMGVRVNEVLDPLGEGPSDNSADQYVAEAVEAFA